MKSVEYSEQRRQTAQRTHAGEHGNELYFAPAAELEVVVHVNGLGAVGDFTVGVFHTAERQYHAHRFQGDFEIVSLVGTITTKDGEFYAHLHMSAGDTEGRVLGGHLNEAVISATCELVLEIMDGTVERRFDPETGLNLMEF